MGNIGSSSGGGDGDGDGDGGSGRRRHGRRRNHTLSVPPPSPPFPQPPTSEIPHNRYVFAAAATPYPNPNPNQYNHYPGYYPPPPGTTPGPLPAPYDHHHHHHYPPQPYHSWAAVGRYHYGPMMPPPLPFVEHQKAVTIRNDVNLKKETLRLEPDPEYPGRFLVSFTFDATVPGRITVVCFAEEGEECSLIPTKEDILPPIVENFEKGLCQKFIQPSGTGIDLAAFEDLKAAFEDLKAADTNIYPLAIKAETVQAEGGSGSGSMNAQITQAMYEKEKGEMKIKVMKQILWVNKMRYELQEIYGIGNTVDDGDEDDVNASDRAKECVICLSEPRDTTVLPCRHMCLCNGCAKVLRFQTNRCPICRQPVERLLEIKVNNGDINGEGDEREELSTTSH